MEQQNAAQNKRIANRVSGVSILVNILLSLGKLAAGILGHSAALISDAVHSASDVFSTLIVIVGIHLSSKAPDEEHQYGHERMECLSALILASILFATGVGIGYQGVMTLWHRTYLTAVIPGRLALIAAGVSIVVKEGMYHYTRFYAKRISSASLMADAWHHRSDALSSVGSLVGVFAARHGFPLGDPIASLLICVFILKAALDIFKDAAGKLVDTSCGVETEEQMREKTLGIEGVLRVDSIQTRQFGAKAYVDLEIAADGTLTLYEAHRIAEQVHHLIETEFPEVKHCMVHVNPAEQTPD